MKFPERDIESVDRTESPVPGRPSTASFDMLRAEAFVCAENTLAVVSGRPFDEVAKHLEACIADSAFAIVHVHDFDQLLRGPATELQHRSRVYEVSNPIFDAQLLTLDPGLAHTLPCRIAMHDHGGVVTVSTPMPTVVIAEFSHAAPVARIARTVQSGLQRVLRAVQSTGSRNTRAPADRQPTQARVRPAPGG